MAITKADVAKLYIALFGRAPDGEGLDYWYNQATSKKWDMAALADNMFYSAKQLYPEYANVQKVVESIYQNVLGKSPSDDPEGIKYWVNEIKAGHTTAGKVAADIIYVAETQYPDNPATKTLENRAEAGVQIAKKIAKPDINGDGKYDDADAGIFKSLISNVKDDPDSINSAVKAAEDYSSKTITLTSGVDKVTGSKAADTFNAPLLTLNDGDTIDGDDGIDTLNASINSDVSKKVTIKNVEKLNFTSYGDNQIDMTNITGADIVKSVKSTGKLTVLNIASTDTGLGLEGSNQNIDASYKDLSGSNDKLKLELTNATNAQITVNSGFESANITVNGNSSIKSFTNNPSKIIISGSGDLKIDNPSGDALGSNNISLFDASNLSGAVITGSDTNNDGFVDDEYISTDDNGATIKLSNSADKVFIIDSGFSDAKNIILLNDGDDKVSIQKGNGIETVVAGKGNDKILIESNSSALTFSDIFDMGDGDDTITVDSNQNNNLMVQGLEKLILTPNASGKNTIKSDSAVAVTAKVNNNNVDIEGLHSGSTVTVENAPNATGGVNNLTVAFAQPEASSTINVNAKANGGNALTINNIKDATVKFNDTVGTSANKYAINTQGVDKLTINAAKAAYFGAETDNANTDTLADLKIVGQDVVTINNLNSSALKNVDISANKSLTVGTATASNNLSTVKYVSTNGAVDFGSIGSDNVTDLEKVTITAKTDIGATTRGYIKAKKIGDVSLTAEEGTLQVNAIGSSATQSISSVKLKSYKNLTASNIDGKNVGSISLYSTTGNISGLNVGDDTSNGNFGNITVKADGKVTITKLGDSDDSFTNIYVESKNGNIAIQNGINANDSDGFNVTLKTTASGGTIDDGDTTPDKFTIENKGGNINKVLLASQGSAKVSVKAGTNADANGYVKEVDATGVTGGLDLSVENNDTLPSVNSTTTIKLGGSAGVTNTVEVSGSVDNLEIIGSAGTDKIVDKAPFASVDKIKDFTSGTDKLYIDLKNDAGGKVDPNKFGKINTVDTAYAAGKTSGAKLQVFGFTATKNGAIQIKTAPASLVKLNTTINKAVQLTANKLLAGKSLVITKTGANTIVKLNGNTISFSKNVTKTKAAVLFFYDTDNHKLVMYGLKVKDVHADKNSKNTVSVTAHTTKIIATISVTNGNLAGGDILVF